jgi:Ca-activated chloride channel family protein
MPVQGSRVDLGLVQATDLLRQAGQGRGDVLLLTDGYTGEEALQAARTLRAAGYRLFVLGVGTAAGAPLADGQGGYLRDLQGDIVMPQLDVPALRKLADAGGGRYATISSTDQDIRYLLAGSSTTPGAEAERTDLTTESWQSRGPWLVLLLLPLAAMVFRRGWLLVLLLQVSAGLGMPAPAMALDWDDLWLRPDQQAARSLQAGAPARAAELAEDPALRGTGAYRASDYEKALEAFAAAGGPDGDYNQGNSLARLGRYQEAIAAYDRALAAQPDMEDAAYNKAQIEKLLEQQRQNRNQNQNQSQNQNQEQQQSGEQQAQEPQSGEQPQAQGEGQSQPEAQQETQPGEQDPSPAADQRRGQQQQDPRAESTDAAEAQEQDKVGGSAPDEATGADPEAQQDAAADEEADSGSEQDRAAQPRQQAEIPGEADGQAGRAAAVQPDKLDSEARQAAEQWLRRIPDDPGGLLRRKFLYQYRQRAGAASPQDTQAW